MPKVCSNKLSLTRLLPKCGKSKRDEPDRSVISSLILIEENNYSTTIKIKTITGRGETEIDFEKTVSNIFESRKFRMQMKSHRFALVATHQKAFKEHFLFGFVR